MEINRNNSSMCPKVGTQTRNRQPKAGKSTAESIFQILPLPINIFGKLFSK